MALKRIRLELARTKEAPEGDSKCGYDFIAPLDPRVRLDVQSWRRHRSDCTVHRFWRDAEDEHGMLIHTSSGRWVFSYAPGDDDDEPIFKLDRHTFNAGDYVSITEHDGITRPFRVALVSPINDRLDASANEPSETRL